MWKPVLRALPRRSVSTRATACHDMQVLTLAASHARAARSTGDDAASDAPDASAAPITPCVVSALRMRPQLAFEGGRSGSVAADEASALRAAAVMADVAAAQKSIFGVVQGNNLRSGRKVLRSNLRGAAIKSWYPTDVMSLNLERVGVENPVREELYRAEQVENRIGKTRMKGKVRPPTPKFLQRMRLEDEQEALLDQVDWFYAEDVLPDQEIVDDLLDGLNEEETQWMKQIFAGMAAEAENGRVARLESGEATTADSKDDKKARARKMNFRRGLQDKRLKPLENEAREAEETPAAGAEAATEGGAEAGAGEQEQGEEVMTAAAPLDMSEEDKRMFDEIESTLAAIAKAGEHK